MRTQLVLLYAAAAAGCGSPQGQSHATAPVLERGETIVMTTTIVAPPPMAAAAAAPPAPKADAPKLFADGIASVRFLATTAIRSAPRGDADKLGVIRSGTRVAVRAAAPGGNGCARGRWLQLEPRGWACEAAVAPSREAPTTAEPATLEEAAALPAPVAGVYGVVYGKDVAAYATADEAAAGEHGRVLTGAHTVRAAGSVTVDGRRFWRTSQGDLIEASAIAVIGHSEFRGVALAEGAPLPAWVRAKRDPRKPALTRGTPDAAAPQTGLLAPRGVVTILELSADGAFARIADATWVAREDLRAASLAEPPAEVAAGEKWFDVDLAEQVLVAYEGTRPVYATLVSTGKYGHATPTRTARLVSKLQSAHMISTQKERYSVADVPWTMYYDGNYALHTSYWHDGFGGPRSHGCVNLSPRDARALYRWSSPDVPPGWIEVYGTAEVPGSLVRVRAK